MIGACIGTDAHTVGIDAILNIKGWAGEKGLEAYSDVEVHNLGAQVSVPDLVEHAQNLQGRCRARQPGRDPARGAPAQRHARCRRPSARRTRPAPRRC